MTAAEGKNCLVTVTSKSFIPGTLVMIHSFLKYNPWFLKAGHDIVIIHDAISAEMQQHINCFDNITWLHVGNELKKRVNALCNGVPHLDLAGRKKRFYSMELFRLNPYRNVIFCDSDILFLGSIAALFQEGDGPRDLLCCGDLHYYNGTPADAVTLMPTRMRSADLLKTFNAGFMVVPGHFLTPLHYQGLLALLDIDRWRRIESPRTDQVIYNLYFKDHCRILDSRYNFLTLHATLISEKEDVRAEEIKVVHFNGKTKPWDISGALDTNGFRPAMIPWIRKWHREYLDFLPRYHLRRRFANKAAGT